MAANRTTKACRDCGAGFTASASDYTVRCPACRGRTPKATATSYAAITCSRCGTSHTTLRCSGCGF